MEFRQPKFNATVVLQHSRDIARISSGKVSLVKNLEQFSKCRKQSEIILVSRLLTLIGPENSRNSLIQSGAKLKPITTWSPAFSRALDSLVVYTFSSHWLLEVFSFVLIGLGETLDLRHSTKSALMNAASSLWN